MPLHPETARSSNAWPFVEARKLVERTGGKTPAKGYVLFETGYGPSGLPHIGTFGEVARTTMVRHAFAALSDIPSRLFAFSDDMDGLRKVPDNVPNAAMMERHLAMPLTAIPDPFGDCHESYGHHNNDKLRQFLDTFGFDYEFKSATACYKGGTFDQTLLSVLRQYDAVMAAVLPTLRAERQQTFSPFLPVCPTSGKVLQVPIISHDEAAGTIAFTDDSGRTVEVPVTGGRCKLGWKTDWAMRWRAFEVDYEMSGKDLIDSVKLSSAIVRILGGAAPEGFTYELFLDENGEKISKSRGNGLTIEEWLTYGSRESLALYMYLHPRKAKRLTLDVIPRHVDDYLEHLRRFPDEAPERRLDNPVWHIHAGRPPAPETGLSYAVLLNLASVCNTEDKAVLWGFIARYAPGADPATSPILDELAACAINYYRDFVKPKKAYRAPNELERMALEDLAQTLEALPRDASAAAVQNEVYEVGKRHGFATLRDWFKALYEVLFGQSEGPRMGSFIALYGLSETAALIRRALRGEDLAA